MSEPLATDTTVESPTERAHARDVDDSRGTVPSVGATPTAASAASVSDGTVDTEVARDAPRVVSDLPVSPVSNGATNGAPPGEVEVECPGCGLILTGQSPRPTAAWFCPRCDYPVFWASPPPPSPEPQQRARRRLPGTSGATVLGAGPCWNCGELNEPDSGGCIRCAATLPRPRAPEPETRIVTVQTPVPVAYPLPSAVWPFVAAGTLAGAGLAISATSWLLRLVGGG